MDLLQNQEKQFYEDELSSRKSRISQKVDEECDKEWIKFNANFATTPSRDLRCSTCFEWCFYV